MPIFGARKWLSRSVGDFIGVYDNLGSLEYLRKNSTSGNKCNEFRPRHSFTVMAVC